MFKAEVIKSFTYGKRHDHLFRKGSTITDLEKEDVEYLKANGVIDKVTEIKADKREKPLEAEVVIETAEIKAKPEKAVRKTTKKK